MGCSLSKDQLTRPHAFLPSSASSSPDAPAVGMWSRLVTKVSSSLLPQPPVSAYKPRGGGIGPRRLSVVTAAPMMSTPPAVEIDDLTSFTTTSSQDSDTSPEAALEVIRTQIKELHDKPIAELVGLVAGKRGSASAWYNYTASETDRDMNRRGSFCDKSISSSPTYMCPQSLEKQTIGYACKKGLKPVIPNQDSFVILQAEAGWGLYGIFDGHGKNGHFISNFAKENIPKLFLNSVIDLNLDISNSEFSLRQPQIQDALKNAFVETQKMLEVLSDDIQIGKKFPVSQTAPHPYTGALMDSTNSGCTATVVITNKHDLMVAHVGDSRAVFARPNLSVRCGLKGEDITRDHKPELSDERARIIKSGGDVHRPSLDAHYRVYVKGQRYPGLAMSRALGDLTGNRRAGVSHLPEVTTMSTSCPSVVLLCSDGVWEFISTQEAVEFVSRYDAADAMAAAQGLAKLAWDRWIDHEDGQVVDDITAVVIFNSPPPPPAPLLATHHSGLALVPLTSPSATSAGEEEFKQTGRFKVYNTNKN